LLSFRGVRSSRCGGNRWCRCDKLVNAIARTGTAVYHGPVTSHQIANVLELD
jgi:hypothetical protein